MVLSPDWIKFVINIFEKLFEFFNRHCNLLFLVFLTVPL